MVLNIETQILNLEDSVNKVMRSSVISREEGNDFGEIILLVMILAVLMTGVALADMLFLSDALFLKDGSFLRGGFTFETGGKRQDFRPERVSRLSIGRGDTVASGDSNNQRLSLAKQSEQPAPFDVKLEDHYFRSDIQVKRGQRVTVQALGNIYLEGGTATGPEGFQGRRDSKAPMPQENDGALVAAIGQEPNSPAIFIGRSRVFTADRDGILYFTINHRKTSDANGVFHVFVAIDRSSGGNTGADNRDSQSKSDRSKQEGSFELTVEDRFLSTDIQVKRGQRVRVVASGNVYGTNTVGLGNTGPEGFRDGRRDSKAPMPQENDCALIASIGKYPNSPAILIGRLREFIADRDGILYLAINHGEIIRNNGYFHIYVAINPSSVDKAGAGDRNSASRSNKDSGPRSWSSQKKCIVHAIMPWNDTGIDVKPNMTFNIEASGTIQIDYENNSDANGNRSVNVDHLLYPMDQFAVGALIGKIHHRNGGDSKIVLIGSRGQLTTKPNEYGRLFLGVNDSRFSDNAGFYQVTIRW